MSKLLDKIKSKKLPKVDDDGSPKSKLAAALARKSVKPAKKPAAKPVPTELKELGNMEISTDEPATHKGFGTEENFHYAEQADKVDDPIVQQFYENMHEIANSFDDPNLPELLAEHREFLNQHEELQALLLPEDIGLLVKALAHSYKNAAIKKAAGKTGRKTKTSKRESAAANLLDGIF